MNKKAIIIVAILAVIALVIGIFSGYKSAEEKAEENKKEETKVPTSNITVNSVDDLTALVDKIYEGISIEMPMLMTQAIDITDSDAVKMFTGLDSAENIEYLVASEPMMSSQAYSMVLVKVKDGADIDAIANAMNENVDERKWICVTAEKIHTTMSGNVICLVMSNADTAKAVYDSFKTLAGTTGQEFERTAEEVALPEDMLPGQEVY